MKQVNEEVCSEKRNKHNRVCRDKRREESPSNQGNGKAFTEEVIQEMRFERHKISRDKRRTKCYQGREQGETKLESNEMWENQEAVSIRV